jgi:hypothetical protein
MITQLAIQGASVTKRFRGTAALKSMFLGVLLITAAWRLPAQSVGGSQIGGTVTDPSGGLVPSAKVKAVQTETGQERSTVTSSTGSYVIPNLPVGPYTLTVTSEGFQSYVDSGIILTVGSSSTVNVALKVGDTSQSVQVTADAAMVQAQDTSISEVIDPRRIIDLPLNGRQATDLILLAGGTATDSAASFGGANALVTTKSYPNSVSISVAGSQPTGNSYVMDGGDNNDTFSNVNLPFPFPDALQEFSVETNGLSAQFGIHPGSVVNVITKAGTNQFHGDLFEFVRNGDFNARNFFAASQDTLRRNQFGGTVGAPIKKDKLFGFFGYQDTIVRTAPPQSISFVPTQAALSGNFSTLESSACQSSHTNKTVIDPLTGKAFPNNQVPVNRFSPQALSLAKYLPVSNDPCGQLTYGIPNPSNESQYIGRVDWLQSAKNSLFSRYFILNYNNPPLFDGTNGLTTSLAGQSLRSQSAVIGDNYSISANVVNTMRVTYTRMRDNRYAAPNLFTLASAGVNIFQYDPHFINLSVSGDFSFGCGNCATSHFNRNTYEGADSLDIIRGKHQIQIGADYQRLQMNEFNLLNANGTISFNGQITGNPLLDFLLGSPSSLSQNQPDGMAFRQNYIGVYAQDNFQVTRNLNIHYGVRWEPFLPERDLYGRGSYFSQSAFLAGTKSSVYTNSPAGVFFQGDSGVPSGYLNSNYKHFAPRIGIAWDPTGNGKQSLRASYGIFYDRPNTFFNAKYADEAPWGNSVTLASPSGGLANPYASYPGGNPFPTPLPPAKNSTFPSGAAYINFPLSPNATYVQQWGFSYELQPAKDWLVSLNYIGNKSTHLWAQFDANHGIYIPGTCGSAACSTTGNINQRRILYLLNPAAGAAYGSIDTLDDGANANYNGVIVKAQHRFSQNFSLLSSYTYSHCLQDSQLVVNDLSNGPLYQNPNNRNADHGPCEFDLRQNAVASLVILSPKFAGRWTNMLLGDWQLSPIISAHSGGPFNPTTGVDNSRTGEGADRPNILGNPYTQNLNTRAWLNTAAFSANTVGTFGNAGWNSLVGPSYFDLDVSLSRWFTVRESQKLQLRFEFFNATNHVNFANPSSGLNTSTFGTIFSAGNPRILQFAAKYVF